MLYTYYTLYSLHTIVYYSILQYFRPGYNSVGTDRVRIVCSLVEGGGVEEGGCRCEHVERERGMEGEREGGK